VISNPDPIRLRQLSLPFKGRAGVGMGKSDAGYAPHPPPVLPLEGGGT
jgi:hypothetical protein